MQKQSFPIFSFLMNIATSESMNEETQKRVVKAYLYLCVPFVTTFALVLLMSILMAYGVYPEGALERAAYSKTAMVSLIGIAAWLSPSPLFSCMIGGICLFEIISTFLRLPGLS